MKIEGIKHDSFRITDSNSTVIYIDPWELPVHEPKADLILVSHIHIGEPFHPKDPNFVGFILTLDGARIYFAGDTEVLPPEVRNIDVALIPVDGHFTMTAEEAAAMVRDLKPGRAIPMPYGTAKGTRADAERFQTLVAPIPVEIHS